MTQDLNLELTRRELFLALENGPGGVCVNEPAEQRRRGSSRTLI